MVRGALYAPSPAPLHRAGLLLGNDIGSQSFVEPATNAFTRLGGQVKNFRTQLRASDYRTEVTQVIAYKPAVIFTEALGSAGTFLGEYKTLNGGTVTPFIGTSATIDPQWFKQVSDSIGVDNLVKNYGGVDLGYTFSGPAYTEFQTNLNAAASQFADAPKYKQRGSTLHLYDGIIMTALAMVATNSSDPKVYNSKIKEIANGVSGATVVNTYKDGVAALKAGKSIRFVGAGGENNFDQYNNSVSGYILVKYDAQGNEVRVAQLTPDQTKAISDAGGI